MKKIIILLMSMLMVQALASTSAFDIEWWNQATYSNLPSNKLKQWAEGMEGRVGFNSGTGSIFYVDSGVASEGDGSSWTNAKNTLDEAIDLCTDDAGDVIYVAQGHAEDLSAAGTVTCDKSGVTIIGCSYGDLRPTFTTTATAGTFLVSDNAVTVYNLRFVPGISAVVTCVSVSATGDQFSLLGCEFTDPGTATYEFINMVTLASGSDFVTISGNKMVSTVSTTGCVNAILASAGVVNRLTITNNDIQGNFITTGAIYSNQINTNMLIAGNTVGNTATGIPAINLTAAATGFIVGNSLYSDTFGTAGVTILDPGSCSCIENYAINTTDLSAIRIPPDPAISAQSVTAGSWIDILNKLYYASDGTGAYPATVANDSTIAKIMAKGATATASTFDNTTDSLEAISDLVTTADTVVDAILADTVTGEQSISKTITTIANGANNLFAVAGGPIKITEIVAYVTTTAIGSEGCLVGYNIDPTTPATDTAFGTDGTALELNAAAVGSLITWDGVLAADLVKTANGVAVAAGTDVSYGLIVPIGMIELTAAHDGACTGEITVYMRYVALSPLSTVTAQ